MWKYNIVILETSPQAAFLTILHVLHKIVKDIKGTRNNHRVEIEHQLRYNGSNLRGKKEYHVLRANSVEEIEEKHSGKFLTSTKTQV